MNNKSIITSTLVLTIAIGLTSWYFFINRSTISSYVTNIVTKYKPVYSEPELFSLKSMLAELWNDYKSSYLESGTNRTLDKQRDNITTSEGQSYTMLRAVWQDDQDTFNNSWKWTQDNLQRKDDKLFSWLFGKKTDGSYGILKDQGGQNTASDGDVDIALSNIFAYSRWNKEIYLTRAKETISDIWNKEIVDVNGELYLVANNLEKAKKDTVIVNPSYLSPHAFKIFAQVDPEHDWNKVVDSSYRLIQKSSEANLDTSTNVGLIPDWVIVNRKTGDLESPQGDLKTYYSYDAMRLPFKLALDWQWNQDPRAKEALERMNFLETELDNKKHIYAGYTHEGTALVDYDVPAFYGGSMGYFKVLKPQKADQLFKQKLRPLYSMDSLGWKEPISYYDDNWAWFGMALYSDNLPNLAATIQFTRP